jgi:hypothetical protein
MASFDGAATASGSPSPNFRGILHDATRYWELRRIPYNLALVALVIFYVVRTWPHFQPAVTIQVVPYLLVFAGIANILYSAAYLADIPLQLSLGTAYSRWRWILWLGGTLVAVLLAAYWIADEIYPYPYVN